MKHRSSINSRITKSFTMLKNSSLVALLVALVLMVSSCQDDENPSMLINSQDRDFANEASYSNLAKIEFGQLALSSSQNASVLNFAETILTEHTNAQNQLEASAGLLEVILPNDQKDGAVALYQQVSEFQGAAFDSAYIQSQIVAHQESQLNYQKQLDNGANPELLNYAATTLLKINMHMETAISLRDELASAVPD